MYTAQATDKAATQRHKRFTCVSYESIMHCAVTIHTSIYTVLCLHLHYMYMYCDSTECSNDGNNNLFDDGLRELLVGNAVRLAASVLRVVVRQVRVDPHQNVLL